MLSQVLTRQQRQALEAFAQQPDGYFGAPLAMVQQSAQQPAVFKSYNPQSGQIFGVLKQMKETFETNLASSQKEEGENQDAYESLKSAKESEIAAGQAQVEAKTAELADTDEKNAASKEDK